MLLTFWDRALRRTGTGHHQVISFVYPNLILGRLKYLSLWCIIILHSRHFTIMLNIYLGTKGKRQGRV